MSSHYNQRCDKAQFTTTTTTTAIYYQFDRVCGLVVVVYLKDVQSVIIRLYDVIATEEDRATINHVDYGLVHHARSHRCYETAMSKGVVNKIRGPTVGSNQQPLGEKGASARRRNQIGNCFKFMYYCHFP